MKTENAIKTLEKEGFKVVSNYHGFYSAYSPSRKSVVEFLDQDGAILCVKVRGVKVRGFKDVDNVQCKNLKQAMLLAN